MDEINTTIEQKSEVATPKKNSKVWVLISFLICLLGAILLICAFCLPYATLRSSYKDSIDELGETFPTELVGINMDDLKDVSFVKAIGVYFRAVDVSDYGRDLFGPYVVVILAIGIFSALTLLFAGLKKATPLIIINLFNSVLFFVFENLLVREGILPNLMYTFGIASRLYYLAFFVLWIGSIWLFVAKFRVKHPAKI